VFVLPAKYFIKNANLIATDLHLYLESRSRTEQIGLAVNTRFVFCRK